MKLRLFLTKSENIEKDSYIWNMIGSMLNAFQSVIILMAITRTIDLYEAGIYTIANTNANLFLNIGKYGIRNFQVSDTKGQFSFSEYLVSRYITTFIMILSSIIYIIFAAKSNNYSMNKSLIILFMCVFKAIDSIEDVYFGAYQRDNRLDIAGKCMSIRMFITILIFLLALVISRSLLISTIIATTATFIIYLILINDSYSYIYNKKRILKIDISHAIKIFKICFPLFIGLFLSFYIGNAPKYSIDKYLSEEAQACYGFISMPVFVIFMLAGFVFNPIIAKMSLHWHENDIKSFNKIIKKELLIILLLILVCEIGGYILGIPVLSLLYHTDLTNYKTELLILLLGGGLFAISWFFVTVLTIMRKQNYTACGYIIVAILAFILSPAFVKKYEIIGASLLYLVLMFLLCAIFSLPIIIKRKTK